PQWVEYAYGSLSGVDLGPFFHEAVNAWLELERVQGFKSAGSLPKAKRPDEITKWISAGRGRRGTYTDGPKLPEDGPTAAAFGADTTGRVTAWERSTAQGYNELPETWATLHVAGANGPFIALLGVYWWGREEIKAGGKHSDEWTDMVQDFEW
ncbi:hypothetical protein C8F04DRAFT_887444, partial [Mycena alexandri]